MNRYTINICDDAMHSLSIDDANRMRECAQNEIDAYAMRIANAHIKTLCDTGRAHMLSLREYSVEQYTDEYHLLFTSRVAQDVDTDEMNDDDFERENDIAFVASFQII